jgi:hypothetical protein
MISFIEPIYKTKTSIQFGWKREPGAKAYRIYVGLGPATSLLALLPTPEISDIPDNTPATMGKVTYKVEIADVQALLSLPATWDFSNKAYYFAITFQNTAGSWSAIADSTIVEVPPVGITVRQMKDDPTINRHDFVFSSEVQRWTKMAGSTAGAVITDSADFFKSNITMEYTWDGTNLAALKSYPSDATSAGMPAKLTTYTYTGSTLNKVSITDSTI